MALSRVGRLANSQFSLINRAIFAYSTTSESKCPVTHQSSTAEDVKKLKFQDSAEDYAKAIPFADMPGPSLPNFFYNAMIPGKKYFGLGLKVIHTKLFEEYGTVVKFPGMFGREGFVFIYDANLVEKVFRNEGQYPDRRAFEFIQEFREKYRPELFKGNGGLLQEQGHDWQTTRTKVNPVMMQPKAATRYIGNVDKISQEFITRIRTIRSENGEVPADFGNEMSKWALESISYIALDQRLGLLKDIEPDSNAQKLIESVHEFFILSYELEVKPSMWKIYKTPTYKRMMELLNVMTDVLISYVDKSIETINSREVANDHEESILEKLLKIDKKVAIVMALDMLMAGVDTTSNNILILLYQLAKNPEKQNLLRKEILEKLPTKDSVLTADLMKNMPYLRACMKEAQRIEPVIVGTVRRVVNDIVLGGYQVPKNTYIALAQHVMSNSEENFPQKDKFIPERFLKADPVTDLKNRQPFSFLPFGFGPRICIGKRLAELEIEIMVSRIIREFEVKWEHEDIKYGSNTFLNAPTGDLKFKFVDIKE